ncbi:MAG TPA: methyltransferase domain-containing protein [Acidimicrobiales bacterium]|nr:methyltransferase domain-containing protein [Acidimicrobiales bacterium]
MRSRADSAALTGTTEWRCEIRGRALTLSAAAAFGDVVGCPLCHGPLSPAERGAFACAPCGALYPATDGLADLVPPEPGQAETPNMRIMESGLLARVYERAWRPVLTLLLTGMSHDAERAWSLDRLAPAPGATVLDLACGPGNTTRTIAAAVPAGRVLGIDFSMAMLPLTRSPERASAMYAAMPIVCRCNPVASTRRTALEPSTCSPTHPASSPASPPGCGRAGA